MHRLAACSSVIRPSPTAIPARRRRFLAVFAKRVEIFAKWEECSYSTARLVRLYFLFGFGVICETKIIYSIEMNFVRFKNI